MDKRDSKPSIPSVFLRRPSPEAASPNERVILDLIRQARGASRADLVRSTGLTSQSLSRIVDELSARGLVELGPARAHGRGQPSSPVYICPQAAYTAGISIMTDAVVLGIMDFDGRIVCEHSERMDMADVDAVIKKIHRFIDASFTKHRLNRERLLGAGIGITGYFIGDGHKVNPPGQLDNWALIDVAALFEKRLGLPVWLDNDGNVAAVGECLTGVGLELPSFAYLFFSAGFGGGIILNGKLYRGINGNAGEFASILPDGVPSPNLENLRQHLSLRGMSFETIGDMLDNFDPDWPGVEDWAGPAVQSLNYVISAISAIIDVNAIVFGGRIPKALAGRLIPRLSYFNPSRRAHHRPVPKIVASSVTHDAAMIGAASLPLKALFYG